MMMPSSASAPAPAPMPPSGATEPFDGSPSNVGLPGWWVPGPLPSEPIPKSGNPAMYGGVTSYKDFMVRRYADGPVSMCTQPAVLAWPAACSAGNDGFETACAGPVRLAPTPSYITIAPLPHTKLLSPEGLQHGPLFHPLTDARDSYFPPLGLK